MRNRLRSVLEMTRLCFHRGGIHSLWKILPLFGQQERTEFSLTSKSDQYRILLHCTVTNCPQRCSISSAFRLPSVCNPSRSDYHHLTTFKLISFDQNSNSPDTGPSSPTRAITTRLEENVGSSIQRIPVPTRSIRTGRLPLSFFVDRDRELCR